MLVLALATYLAVIGARLDACAPHERPVPDSTCVLDGRYRACAWENIAPDNNSTIRGDAP